MRDPLSRFSIKFKLALGFVGLCTLAFGIGGYLVSQTARASLEKEILQRLAFQSQAYASDLLGNLEMLMRRSEDFASDGYIRSRLTRIVEKGLKDSEVDQAELHRYLKVNKLPLERTFSDLVVVSATGEVLVAIEDARSEAVQGLGRWSVGQSQSTCSSLFPSSSGESPTFYISTPLYGLRDGEAIGHLLVKVRSSLWVNGAMHTDRLERNRAEEDVSLKLIDPSGKSLLVPAFFLNYRDSDAVAVIEGRGLKIHSVDEVRVFEEEPSVSKKSYRQIYPIGNTGWRSEVSIRSQKALASVSGLQSEFLLVGLVLAAISIILMYFPLRYLAYPLTVLRDAALKIRQGDFSVRVEMDSDDEMGELAQSFNLMASAVENRTRELEETATILKDRQVEADGQRDRLNSVIATMQDGLVVLDSHGKVLLSNHAAGPLKDLFDSQSEEQGRTHIPCPENQVLPSGGCAECISNPGGSAFNCMLDIGDRVFEIHASSLNLGGELGQGRVLVGRDVTERVSEEEREVHQERLAALGEVAAVMAHELNNPLASISMFNQLLEGQLDDDSPLQENVEVIARNTETCKKVIRELLGYASAATGEFAQVDVHETLADVVRFVGPVAERKQIHFDWDLKAEQCEVEGDEVQLRQIFVNLIMNAIQASSSGVRIALATQNRGPSLVVDVADTGPGIPESAQANIFRAFFTTKAKGEGTGLGLPTAKRIAEQHGGGLELKSTSSDGTCFEVRLQLVRS